MNIILLRDFAASRKKIKSQLYMNIFQYFITYYAARPIFRRKTFIFCIVYSIIYVFHMNYVSISIILHKGTWEHVSAHLQQLQQILSELLHVVDVIRIKNWRSVHVDTA